MTKVRNKYLSMKITKLTSSMQALSHQQKELSLVLAQLSDHSNRPCQHCTRICPCCNSSSCNCDCSVTCPDAPNELSSEEITFAIEAKILPLVYAFNQMNICQTCWSCEGHVNADGIMNKLPQVWFYTNSLMLIRVLSECISLFKAKKITKYEWQIVSVYTAKDSEMNAFALKPDLNFVAEADLTLLQQDILSIAQSLPKELEKACRNYYQELSLLISTEDSNKNIITSN